MTQASQPRFWRDLGGRWLYLPPLPDDAAESGRESQMPAIVAPQRRRRPRRARGVTRLALTVVAALVATASLYGAQPASAVPFAVSGTVTANGVPLAGAIVYAYQGGDGAVCCTPVAGDETATNGAYSIDLEPGSYRIRFYPNQDGFVEQWYDGAGGFGSATDVVVTNAAVPNINADLSSGSTISGTVTNDAGDPLEGVGVHAMDATQECCVWVTGGETDDDGTYSFTVPNGTYRLYVYSSGSELSEWYDGSPSFDQATDVVIAGGDEVIDAVLTSGAQSISGTITDPDGEGLEDVFVHAFDATAPCCSWVAGGSTDDDGEYSLAVPDGQYILLFYPMSGLMEWWDGAADFDGATVITVAGDSVEGISAELGSGQKLSGTVTADGEPVENVFVGVFDADDVCCTWVAGGATDSDGEFRFDVPNGTYRLLFHPWDGALLAEWWQDAGSFELGADVVVAGGDVEDLDAELSGGTGIRGTVTGDGEPLENVYVGAYSATAGVCCEYVAGTGTNEDGEYTLSVPAGDYKLMFYPWDGEFTAEWWNNATDYDTATTVTVGATDVPLGAADLAGGVAIRGKVTDGSNDIEGAYVIASRVEGAELFWAAGGVTDEDGMYALVVGPGDYKLQFFGPELLLSEWYDDAADEASATPVTVGTSDVELNDVVLAGGTPISGTVTDEATGEPLAGIEVLVHAADCETFAGFGFTDGDGEYSVTVGAGDHYVWFVSYSGYASEWYDDALSCSNGASVVGGDEGIDAALAPLGAGSAVTGVVYDNVCDEVCEPPVAGVTVILQDLDGNSVAQDVTDADGEFSITAPPSEGYLLMARKTGYADEWYDNYYSLADVQNFGGVVAPGDVVAIYLDTMTVTGTTYDGDVFDDNTGSPLPLGGVTVTAYAYDPASSVQGDPVGDPVVSDLADGTYTLTGLPAGDYIFKFSKDTYADSFGVYATWDEAWDFQDYWSVPLQGSTVNVDLFAIVP